MLRPMLFCSNFEAFAMYSNLSIDGFLAQKVGIDTMSKLKIGTREGKMNQSGLEEQDIPTQPMGIYRPELNHLHDHTAGMNFSVANSNALSKAQSGMYASIRFVSHGSDEMTKRGHGGRTGALKSDALERAREIRRLGACWNCWVMKVPVRLDL